MEKFTIEEIRKYILSQDSRGDILYNLSEDNIRRANQTEAEKEVQDRIDDNKKNPDRPWARG